MLRRIDEQEEVTIYNKSKQMIPLQLSDVGSDFYQQQQAQLMPRKTITIPVRYLNINQVHNLMARGLLKPIASK